MVYKSHVETKTVKHVFFCEEIAVPIVEIDGTQM